MFYHIMYSNLNYNTIYNGSNENENEYLPWLGSRIDALHFK